MAIRPTISATSPTPSPVRRVASWAAASAVVVTGLVAISAEGQEDADESEPAAQAVLDHPPTFEGMAGAPGDGDDSVEQATTEFDGRSCWIAKRSLGNNYLYFDVEDERIPDDATTAVVSIEYFDSGPGNFNIHYDAESAKFARGDTVELLGDNSWKSYDFVLDDIRFEDRANSNDFRISTWDQAFGGGSPTPVCVAKVDVRFSNEPPDLEIEQRALGNVFTQPDTVEVGVRTRADTISWKVRDFWGRDVASGTAGGGEATLSGIVDEVGYYSLDVAAEQDGETIASTTTDLALLSSFDVADVPESPFGVVPHFTRQDTYDLVSLAATMGAKNTREAATWGSVESEPGVYTYDRYDPLRAELDDAGISWLPVASYTNRHHDDHATPYTEEGRQAYARYAADVADHYRDDIEWIEIYNEFNIKAFGARGNSPANSQANYYFPMLRAAYEEIKETNPDITVVGGATASVPLDWLEELFALGGLEYMDAVSVHPYVYPSEPEAASELLAELDELIKEYNGGEPKPIWITEQGYPTHVNADGVTEDVQAANLVRSYVTMFSHGVEKFFFYNLMNTRTRPEGREANFGLLRHTSDPRGPYVPKPAYVSYGTMARELTDATYDRTDDIADGIHSHVFTSEGDDLRVLWADDPTTVSVQTGRPVTVTDIMGGSRTLEPHAGRVHLSISDDPVYLRGNDLSVHESEKLSVSTEQASGVLVGDPVDLTLNVDNSKTPRAPIVGSFEIAGESVPVDVRPGERAEIPLTLPAHSTLGTRTYTGELTVHGRPSARLDVDVRVIEPVQVDARHVLDDGADALAVTVSNASGRELDLHELAWTIGDREGALAVPSPLPAGTVFEENVPLDALAEGSHDYDLRALVAGYDDVVYNGEAKIVDHATLTDLPEQSIDVDGTLDDLSGVPRYDLTGDSLGGRWTTATEDAWIYSGDDDLSGEIWATHDEGHFYVSARIQDDVHHQRNPAATIWAGDSLAFTIAPGTPGEEKPLRYYEYRMALGEDGPVLHRGITAGEPLGVVTDVDLEITRDDDTGETIYELALPWRHLAPSRPDDGLLSRSFQVNDNDGLDRKGWISAYTPAIPGT